MARQLALIDPLPDWQLDEQTRAIGRQGLAQARAALAAAKPASPSSEARRSDRQRSAA
ncbi:MAG: hypothetical protein WKF43_10440 [Acidimicrobiales bacterium]